MTDREPNRGGGGPDREPMRANGRSERERARASSVGSRSDTTEREPREDTTLRERLAANPRPALVWLAGALALLALELAAVLESALLVGRRVRWVADGVVASGAWLHSTFVTSVGEWVGLGLFALALLAILALLAVLVKWALVPVSLVEALGFDPGEHADRTVVVAERAVVALALAALFSALYYTPIGDAVVAVGTALAGILERGTELPTLTSRSTIPNEGYRSPDGGWEGTFLGLSPGQAWGLRVGVVYAYALAWIAWCWRGYEIFRRNYRRATWTPRDDWVDRFRGHYWGQFGLLVVVAFVVFALFAPTLGPTTAEANIYNPYSQEHAFLYLDEGGELQETTHGSANIASRSQGGTQNVGPMSYDDYGRFAPAGTLHNGKDLFTFMAHGARVSLVVGLLSIVISGLVAVGLALVTAYYKGLVDLLTVVSSDAVMSLPRFLLVLLLSVLFAEANHPIARLYDGGILLALLFAATGWPFLWRAIRGPSFQVAEEEWIDAARSYGQTPTATMRKHMAPYITGYVLVYASLALGGIIIGVAALSFLGFGITAPTPEWGRAVNEGRQYVTTSSWHIATIPGLLVVLVVTAFNALGDGIRDAIDPQSTVGRATEGAAATGGGG